MKAHRTDGLSLTFGVIFLALTGWWAVGQAVDLALPNLGWFVAGALIVLGALGLVGALRGNRAPAPPVDQRAPVPAMDDRGAATPTEESTRDILDGGEGEPDGPGRGLPAG
jgi:hypothetical protein